MKNRYYKLIIFTLLLLVILFICHTMITQIKVQHLSIVSVTLPDGLSFGEIQGNHRSLYFDGALVGGLYLFPMEDSMDDWVFDLSEALYLLQRAGIEQADRNNFDCWLSSGAYKDWVLTLDRPTESYIHYLFPLNLTEYTQQDSWGYGLWFDRTRVTNSDIAMIRNSITILNGF